MREGSNGAKNDSVSGWWSEVVTCFRMLTEREGSADKKERGEMRTKSMREAVFGPVRVNALDVGCCRRYASQTL